MENKYYTPQIEEFCIGLDFEIKYSTNWNKDVFDEAYGQMLSADFIRKLILKDSIRVKLLDREDIENLGLEFSGTIIGDLTGEKFENTYIKTIDNNYYKMFVSQDFHIDISNWESRSKTNPFTSTLFRGTIKNKLELKKLMSQIGISIKNAK